MQKLHKLAQSESGILYNEEGRALFEPHIRRVGELRTLVVTNPVLDIKSVLDEMAERDSLFIPNKIPNVANSYSASEFNPDTQHIRKGDEGKEKMCSVYAIQFYYAESF